ncbi:MAG TPA: GNAT family N-acetyltransferase [Acidimicrobiales bacterium]
MSPGPVRVDFRDNEGEHRYEMYVDDIMAGIEEYHLRGSVISLIHTEVSDAFAGQGLAPQLVTHVLDEARERGLSVLPFCPYVAKFISKHAADYLDLVPEARRGEFEL